MKFDNLKLNNVKIETIRELCHEELTKFYIRDETHNDEPRDFTPLEIETIIPIMVGAVSTARYTKDFGHPIDTAEWIWDEFTGWRCNGYMTIYNPIRRVMKRLFEMAPVDDATADRDILEVFI